MSTCLVINGHACQSDAGENTYLLPFLRNELGLSGPRFGCGEGACGACMVLVHGNPMSSCDLPLWAVQGKHVETVEGLGNASHPHPIQQALLEERAGQCGYCLSGVAIAAAGLLRRNADPSREQIAEALQRNLCRCGSHNRIIRAVQRAAELIRAPDVTA